VSDYVGFGLGIEIRHIPKKSNYQYYKPLAPMVNTLPLMASASCLYVELNAGLPVSHNSDQLVTQTKTRSSDTTDSTAH